MCIVRLFPLIERTLNSKEIRIDCSTSWLPLALNTGYSSATILSYCYHYAFRLDLTKAMPSWICYLRICIYCIFTLSTLITIITIRIIIVIMVIIVITTPLLTDKAESCEYNSPIGRYVHISSDCNKITISNNNSANLIQRLTKSSQRSLLEKSNVQILQVRWINWTVHVPLLAVCNNAIAIFVGASRLLSGRNFTS